MSKKDKSKVPDEVSEEDQAEALLKQQADLLKRANKATINIGKDPEDRKKVRIYYKRRAENFEAIVTDFQSNHRKLVALVPIEDRDSHSYFEEDHMSLFEEAQMEFITTLHIEQEKRFPEESVQPVPDNDAYLAPQIKLPTITIPHFSGSYTEWKTFHDIFRSIVHKNNKLPGSHKFQYLLGALSGEPRDLIAGFDISDDDYPKAWKLLTERYNDKPSTFMHIMNQFASLEPVTTEDADQLRELIKSTSACLKSLTAVGLVEDQIGSIIAYYLMRKLPVATLSYWEQTRDRTKLPQFEDIKGCIETRIRIASVASKVNRESVTPIASHKFKCENQSKSCHQSRSKKHPPKSSQSFHTSSAPQSSNSKQPAFQSSSKSSEKKFTCPVCNGDSHPLRTCNKFLGMSATERKSTVEHLKHCVNCLAYNHTDAKCRSSHTCFHCGERHHSLLHVSKSTEANPIQTNTHLAATTVNACNTQHQSFSSSNVLLATAIVTVLDAADRPCSLRALIDQGSEANFLTESALTALQLPKQPVQAVINGIGASNNHSKYIASITLRSRTNKAFTTTVETFVLGKLTNLLPSVGFKPQRWDHIAGLTLADPTYHCPGQIDLILGAEIFAQIIMSGVKSGPPGTPVAQQTQLGWILSGRVSTESIRTNTVSSLHTTANIEALMERFISVESIEDVNPMTTEEQWCEKFFVDTHRRNEEGRFIIRLPFRFLFDPDAKLGRSRDIAVKRLHQLERRLAQNSNLKEEYVKAINEYLLSNRMQPTTHTECETDGHVNSAYLPHHAVFKESSTSTKLRVVFDASRQTTNGKALNDILVVGPTIQADIVTIVTNWRFHRIAFTADVQKMYLQVKVDERDIEYQRIVYRNDASEPIQDFCLNRLTFGTSSAPFQAIRCVNQLAEYEQSNFPEASVIMTNDTYVDDVISGGDDVPTVQKLHRDLVEMMKRGGFELKKWSSNSNEILETIPESDRELKLPVELNANDNIKALGIAWNPAADTFTFHLTIEPDIVKQRHTKRTILSTVARLFDPIGYVAPILVTAKIIMKRVWAEGTEWDEEVSTDIRNEWLNWLQNLQHLNEIKVHRWIQTSPKNKSFQLLGFCDASIAAYGAIVYIRTVDTNNTAHIHLLTSKSKVAPKKALTIPRLELCGAHLLAKLVTFVRRNLRHINFAVDDIVLWTDSEIVLYWLRSERPMKVFVENRVAKIKEATTNIRWRHVNTHENPADIITKGCTPTELAKKSLWWHGPTWLRLSGMKWPISRIDHLQPDEFKFSGDIDLEHRRTAHANVCLNDTDIINQFSTFKRLMRITTLCRRFAHNCRSPAKRLVGRFTPEELQATVRRWILRVQGQYYHNELTSLTKETPEAIDNRSKLIALTPFVDGNGILRVRGRLEKSLLPYDEKHPIILPPDSHLTNLIIDRFHERSLHGGTQLVLALIRRRYWIVNGRIAIRRRLRKCITCVRHRASTLQQLMGSLPAARVRQTNRPFLHTGVDYAGPIELRASKGRGIKAYKAYIAVFVCLTVKAIHIECVDGLSTDAFFAAFRRFVARRGLPSDMYSDNGTNFVGAANETSRQIRRAVREAEEKIADKLVEDGIRWHFIPPNSPHFGGLWEAGVKSAKHHLRRVIGESKLTFEEMSTLLCQIEACLNSRPLCALTNDPTDHTALTPGHFIASTDLLTVPEPSHIDTNPNRLDRWKQIQQMRQNFWHRWRNDYLSQLQQRPKWLQQIRNLNIGDMVLVKDDRLPSWKWALGRIVDIHPGEDDLVRVISVRTAAGTYKRSITKICRLPIDIEEHAVTHI